MGSRKRGAKKDAPRVGRNEPLRARREGGGQRERQQEGSATAPKRLLSTTRARNPITDEEIAAAKTWEERGLACLRVLSEGGWDAQVPRLLRIWSCTEPALSNYKRAGRVALAAIQNDDNAKRLEDVLAELRVDAEEHRRLAADCRAHNRPALATRHDDLARKSLELFSELSGFRQHRVTLSIEADPRIAGMYQAILAALEDRDRQEEERRAQLVAWLVEVEKLTGGVLPPGLPAPLPSAREHVRDAVKRYEGEIGARSEARRLAA